MIEHIRANKGKEFLYILPVKPYPHNKIKTYIVCKVKVINVYNTYSKCLVQEVINQDILFPYYSVCKEKSCPINCSNKYLFEIYNKSS